LAKYLTATQATLCVIDARQYQDERVQQHESFIAQAEVADVLVFSKNDVLNDSQRNSCKPLLIVCLRHIGNKFLVSMDS
jgi:G3E family GTPase